MQNEFKVNKIQNLMKFQKNIRNMSVIAHVDHGKSTLSDSLLIRAGFSNRESHGARYMDTRQDEQDRGITIKSTAVSMSFKIPRPILEAYCTKDKQFDKESTDNEFLINLIDSPGHVDFSSEVTAALRVTDGALVVIDVIEGCCVQTETVMRQAVQDKVQVTLCLNKVDRALLELDYSPEELFDVCCKNIQTFNANLMCAQDEDHPLFSELDAGLNEISFCSGLQGWGFTCRTIARMILQVAGKHSYEAEIKFSKVLFSRNVYCNFEGVFPEKYDFVKIKKNQSLPKGKKYPFIQLVLEPLYHVRDLCLDKKLDEVIKYLGEWLVDLKPLKLDTSSEGKKLFKTVLKTWLPAADVLLEQIVLNLPNPVIAQNIRGDYLYTGSSAHNCFSDNDSGIEEDEEKTPVEKKVDKITEAIKNCDGSPDAPLVMYVSKMIPDGSNSFIAVGRIFSGVIKPGMSLYVQNPDYHPIENDETQLGLNRTKRTITKVVAMMGRTTSPLTCGIAGNVIGIVGVEGFLKKTGTITNSPDAWNIRTMKFSVSPVVNVAVKPENTQDLQKFKEGLDKLGKSDPLCQIEWNSDNQAVIGCAGELHMEVILHDLAEFCQKKFVVTEPQVKFYEGICMPNREPINRKELDQNLVSRYDANPNLAIKGGKLFEVMYMAKSPNNHNRISMNIEELDTDVADNLFKVVHKDPKERTALFKKVFKMTDEWIKKILCFAPANEEFPMNIVVDCTKGIQYISEVKDHIITGLKHACLEGPMIGGKVRGIRFNLKDLVLHADAIHRGANQLVRPVEQVARGMILAYKSILYEPIYRCDVTVPDQFASDVEVVVKKYGATIIDVDMPAGSKVIMCHIPVKNSFGINKDLKKASGGHAYCNFVLDHYAICKGSLDDPSSPMSLAIEKIRSVKRVTTKLDYTEYCEKIVQEV